MPFSRANIYARDHCTCQYCGIRYSAADLTFDHVVPVAQGGRKNWDNIVAACVTCNRKKGGRTPKQAGMHLYTAPIRPTHWQLQQHGKQFPPHYLHETWRDWLYWDIELEA